MKILWRNKEIKLYRKKRDKYRGETEKGKEE